MDLTNMKVPKKPQSTLETMVKAFQCPGCALGSNPKCGSYKPEKLGHNEDAPSHCTSHAPGTNILGVGTILLGLPKGFCRTKDAIIRLFDKDKPIDYDTFNVPVWAMEVEEEGKPFLVVRCYQPRIDVATIDVWEGKKFADLPMHPINVAEFVDEID